MMRDRSGGGQVKHGGCCCERCTRAERLVRPANGGGNYGRWLNAVTDGEDLPQGDDAARQVRVWHHSTAASATINYCLHLSRLDCQHPVRLLASRHIGIPCELGREGGASSRLMSRKLAAALCLWTSAQPDGRDHTPR